MPEPKWYKWNRETNELTALTTNYKDKDFLKEIGELYGSDRHVASNRTWSGVFVSTVFLGLDHNMLRSDRPLLFETMIFDTRNNWGESYCARYSTYDEAVIGHKAALWHVKHRPINEQLITAYKNAKIFLKDIWRLSVSSKW
jgi:hypothetical protein